MNTPTTTLDALLGDMARVRAAARSLVRDAASADDLVQDALVVALRKQREIAEVTPGWARTTLRNLSRNEARGRASRDAREREAARTEAVPAASEAAAQAERSRDVSEALLGLKEPYRTVVLLRYVEGLPPRKIAARTGATVETVKKQLTRGQAELKRKLEAKYGDRGAWAVALLPLTGPTVLGSAKAAGALGMAVRAGVALLVLGGVGSLIAEVRREAAPVTPAALKPEPLVDVATASPAASTLAPASPGRVELEMESLPTVASASEEAPEPAAAATVGRNYRGRVVDLNGDPIAGLEIEWTQRGKRNERTSGNMTLYEELPRSLWRRLTLVTDREGAFSIDRYPPPEELNAEWSVKGPPRVSITTGLDADGATVWVLAPAVRVAGIVRDAEMRPVPGASVTLLAGLHQLSSFPLELRETSASTTQLRTDEEGRFHLGAVPFHPAFRIRAHHDGQDSEASVPVPMADDEAVVIQLPESKLKPMMAVFGTVVAADGTPLAGETVFLKNKAAKTNKDGQFRFESRSWYPSDAMLVARRKDFEFQAVPAPTREEALAPGGAGPIELRFPPDRLRIRGQLVDSESRPVDGFLVYVMDGTVAQGGDWRREHSREGHSPGDPLVTGPKGVFTVPQVLDRPYHLRFIDPQTLRVHDVKNVDPSSGPVRVVLPADGVIPELSGVVLDAFGQPVPNARLRLIAHTFVNPKGGTTSMVRHLATTDDRGTFTLLNAPWKDLVLDVMPEEAPNGQSTGFELTEDLVQAPLELRLDLECVIEITKPRGLDVDALQFRTDSDETLSATAYRPGVQSRNQRFDIGPGGAFYPGSVSQRATQVVLFRGEEEVGRRAIRLEAGSPNVIEL